MSSPASVVVFSCEHGGNDVPAAFAELFRTQRARRALRGHRGYDIGALELARRLADTFDAELLATTRTRLLVDMNRAETNPGVFSEFSRQLESTVRRRILDEIHAPYRASVVDAIRDALARRTRVCHVAVHSFTPRWRGAERPVDIGLLYDPARPLERRLCACWRDELRDAWPKLRVRRNFPYRGTADGLTTYLRRIFGNRAYVGVELEVSQRLLRNAAAEVARVVAESLARCLDDPSARAKQR